MEKDNLIQVDEACRKVRVYFDRSDEFNRAYIKLEKYICTLNLTEKQAKRLLILSEKMTCAAERAAYKQGFKKALNSIRIEFD